MNIRWPVASLFCLAITAAAFARSGGTPANIPQRASTEFQDELMNVQKAFIDALERGDAEYVKNTLADDFMVIETNGDSYDKVDWVRSLHPEEHPRPKPVLYQFRVVQLDPDSTVITYNAVFSNSPLDRYQHLSNTWVKQNGEWKLKFQQATINLWSAHDLD